MKKFTAIISFPIVIVVSLVMALACSSDAGDDAIIEESNVDVCRVEGVSFNMYLVPGGNTFIMGEHVETPTQTVTLSNDFWMGETPVTQELWEAVWGDDWPGTAPYDVYGVGPQYPAYNVSWYDSVAFCNMLTIADPGVEGAEQVYYSDAAFLNAYTSNNAENGDDVFVDWIKKGYRLPTEAEWEYAARYIDGTSWNNGDHASGDTTYACYDPGSGPISGSPLASNDRLSEYAWWYGNNPQDSSDPNYGTKRVGQKKANALGLQDMSGNVFEWCYDWSDDYIDNAVTDPKGSLIGTKRVARCGDYNVAGWGLRCAYRNDYNPSLRPIAYGFRLCRTAD